MRYTATSAQSGRLSVKCEGALVSYDGVVQLRLLREKVNENKWLFEKQFVLYTRERCTAGIIQFPRDNQPAHTFG